MEKRWRSRWRACAAVLGAEAAGAPGGCQNAVRSRAHLDSGTNRYVARGAGDAAGAEEEEEERGREEEDVHLDRHCRAIQDAADGPPPPCEEQDRAVEEEHRNSVVEEPKDVE